MTNTTKYEDILLKYVTSRAQFKSLLVRRIFLQLCSWNFFFFRTRCE